MSIGFPDFQFYLKPNDTSFYKVVNGNVLIVDEESPLYNAPSDWEKTGIDFNRDKLYWGVFIEVTEPTQFGGDGAKILRYIKSQQSYEGICIFAIKRLISTTMSYELCYEGELDFSQMHDGRDFVTINCKNRGLQEDLDSQADTTFELDLNVPEALTLSIDGTFVRSKGSWYPGNYSSKANNGILTSSIPFNTTDSNTAGRAVSLYNGDNIDQIFPFIRGHKQSPYAATTGNATALVTFAFNSGNPTIDDGYYLFQANSDLKNIQIDGSMAVSFIAPNVTGTKYVRVKAFVVDLSLAPGNTVVQSIPLHEFSTTAQNIEVGYTATMVNTGLFDMNAGMYLLIVINGQCSTTTTQNAYFPIENGYFNVYYDAKIAPTDTKCLRYYHAAKQLIQKISPSSNLVSSYFNTPQTDNISRFNNFDTSPFYQVLMSGDALTQKTNPKIKTRWKDMWQDMSSREALSLSIENGSAIIEKLDYVFSNEKLATIESVSNIDWYDFSDKIFNNLKIGFPESDQNTQSGQQEALTTSEYLTGVRRYKNENNSVSSYIAAPSQIEAIRGYTLNSKDSSTINNNDTFITEVSPNTVAGKYRLYRPAGTISGITDTSNAYGLTLTQGRAVNRKRALLRSSVPFGQLTFQTSSKNQNLVSTFSAGQIVEDANIPLDSDTYLGHTKPRYFLPYLVEFDCVPTVNLLNIVKANPKGYIEYNHYGNMLGGYIYEMNILPATNECHMILILRADTDMNLFIR